MGIKDLRFLVTANDPVASPMLAPLIIERIADQREGDKPHAVVGTTFRHSDATKCSRALEYKLTGVEVTEPMDMAGIWVTNLGTLIHTEMQEAIATQYPGARFEVACEHGPGLSSGSADLFIPSFDGWTEDGDVHGKVVGEIKTINGFGYKKAVGDKYPADGPRWSARVQGALNALALDADWMMVLYLAMEAIAKTKEIDELRRFCAEWWYPREVWEPWAVAELERWSGLRQHVSEGNRTRRVIPDPELPRGAVVTDPSRGVWQVQTPSPEPGINLVVESGTTWHCRYCAFQSHCCTDV